MTEYKVAPLTWLRTKFAELNHTHSEYVNSTIVDNLTSDDNTKVLSAKQGKVLKTLVDGKANSSHNHDDRYYTESEIDNKIITDVSGLTDNQGLLFSGDYEDLDNKPTIPTNLTELSDELLEYDTYDSKVKYYNNDTDEYDEISTKKDVNNLYGHEYFKINDLLNEEKWNGNGAFVYDDIILIDVPNGSWCGFDFNFIPNTNSKLEFDIVLNGGWDNELFEFDVNLTETINHCTVIINENNSALFDFEGEEYEVNNIFESNHNSLYFHYDGGSTFLIKNIKYYSESVANLKINDEIFEKEKNKVSENILVHNFTDVENYINCKIPKKSSIKFYVENVNNILGMGDAYIQLNGDNYNNIQFGFFGDDIHLIDNLSGDDWTIQMPNKNSFEMEIEYPNVDLTQNGNQGVAGDTYDYDIIVYVDNVKITFSTIYTLSGDDTVDVFDRNIFYELFEDSDWLKNIRYKKLLYEKVPITFTYEDNSTETINVLSFCGGEDEY